MIGIYKIESPSGKIYIGQSVDINKRFLEYKGKTDWKYKKQVRLLNSFRKYGIENHIFTVMEECNLEELNIKERYWQEFYNVLSDKGLNCFYQGHDGKSGKMSDEVKQKISSANKGCTPWNKGVKTGKAWNKGIKTGIDNGKRKKVIDTVTGEVCKSMTEASLKYNIDRKTLGQMLTGKIKNKTNLEFYTDNN